MFCSHDQLFLESDFTMGIVPGNIICDQARKWPLFGGCIWELNSHSKATTMAAVIFLLISISYL